jgi:hypothetical protein
MSTKTARMSAKTARMSAKTARTCPPAGCEEQKRAPLSRPARLVPIPIVATHRGGRNQEKMKTFKSTLVRLVAAMSLLAMPVTALADAGSCPCGSACPCGANCHCSH